MEFNDQQISSLRSRVKERLSEKRFQHTLGVEKSAVYIAERCIPDFIDEIRVAALLHDISKEYSEAEHLDIIKTNKISVTDEDKSSIALLHSITGPYVIESDFEEYASEKVLSAVRNHTVGSPDMSIFDEIIYLADYIEENRTYPMCVEVREFYNESSARAKCIDHQILALHLACINALDNTIREFTSRGKSYNQMTKLTRDSLLAKTERY